MYGLEIEYLRVNTLKFETIEELLMPQVRLDTLKSESSLKKIVDIRFSSNVKRILVEINSGKPSFKNRIIRVSNQFLY